MKDLKDNNNDHIQFQINNSGVYMGQIIRDKRKNSAGTIK